MAIKTRDWMKAFVDLVLGLAIAAAVCSVAMSFKQPLDAGIAYAGAVLNVGGLILVAIGLSDARRKFNEPSLFGRVSAAIGDLARATRLWFQGRPPDQFVEGAFISSGSSVAAGFGVSMDLTSKDLTRRVTLLEEELKLLRVDHSQRLDAAGQAVDGIQAGLATEAAERGKAIEQLQAAIRELAIGDLHTAWLGFWWLLCGEIATGFSSQSLPHVPLR